jgi:hypothetical protein
LVPVVLVDQAATQEAVTDKTLYLVELHQLGEVAVLPHLTLQLVQVALEAEALDSPLADSQVMDQLEPLAKDFVGAMLLLTVR